MLQRIALQIFRTVMKAIFYSFVLCAALCLVTTVNLQAQQLQWNHSSGGDGGTVLSLVTLDANTMLAGTEVGLFISTDAGKHWLSEGIHSASINALCTDGKAVYAGIGYSDEDGSGGVFKSLDGGSTWTKNLTSEYVWSVAATTDLICVGTDANGVFCSSDGAEWTQGLKGETVYSVCIIGSEIYALADQSGLYRSKDNGKTWTKTGLVSKKGLYAVCGDSTQLYVGGEQGLFRSVDGAKTWTNSGIGAQSVWSLMLHADRIFVGTDTSGVISRVGTGAWQNSDLSQMTVYALCYNGSEVFAGSYDYGVYYSSDNGLSFTDCSDGLTAAPMYSFCQNNSSCFAAGDGILRSNDGGMNWEWLDFSGMVYQISANNGIVLALTDDGFYYSSDNGDSWNQFFLSGRTLYCGISFAGHEIFGSLDSGLYVTTDNGESFDRPSIASSTILCLVRVRGNLFAGSSEGCIYRSVDTTKSWQLVFRDSSLSIQSLVITNDKIIASTYTDDIYFSNYEGSSWEHRSLNSILQTGVSAVCRDEGTLYAATFGNAVWSSTDNASTWTQHKAGLDNQYCTAVGLSDPNVLTASNGSGIYYSAKLLPAAVSEESSDRLFFHPNPAASVLHLALNSKNETITLVRLSDMMGRVVKEFAVQAQNVDNRLNLDVSELATGSYQVLVETRSGSYVQQLMVVH